MGRHNGVLAKILCDSGGILSALCGFREYRALMKTVAFFGDGERIRTVLFLSLDLVDQSDPLDLVLKTAAKHRRHPFFGGVLI